MKYLKIYENFMDSRNSGIAADLEAGEIENDQIYTDMDADNFGTEESQFGAEEILAKWEEAFGEKTPTTQEKYDFYHDLRQEGFDGMLIFDTLGDKMDREEDEYSFDDDIHESNEACEPCGDDEDEDKEKEDNQDNEELDEECSSCNCMPCKCN